jgi:hypothetical protein
MLDEHYQRTFNLYFWLFYRPVQVGLKSSEFPFGQKLRRKQALQPTSSVRMSCYCTNITLKCIITLVLDKELSSLWNCKYTKFISYEHSES